LNNDTPVHVIQALLGAADVSYGIVAPSPAGGLSVFFAKHDDSARSWNLRNAELFFDAFHPFVFAQRSKTGGARWL
jgi:hypothetical protein